MNMKIIKKFTNGILLVIIGMLHTRFALSADGFGKQFQEFSKSHFFYLYKDIDKLMNGPNREFFESFSAFWFFYFGLLIFPLGVLVHSIEKRHKILPHSFTLSYLVFVIIGSYMLPESGMTYFMLPHAIYMLISNYIKSRKLTLSNTEG